MFAGAALFTKQYASLKLQAPVPFEMQAKAFLRFLQAACCCAKFSEILKRDRT
jgi:hypothetical protein